MASQRAKEEEFQLTEDIEVLSEISRELALGESDSFLSEEQVVTIGATAKGLLDHPGESP